MTNKNKNKLVDQSDDDPTSEIEIPVTFRKSGSFSQPEIEVDEPTFDIDELGQKTGGRTRAELETALNDQAKLTEEVSFELEQMRSQHRGLEAELSAREEIAAKLLTEIEEAQARADDAVRALAAGEESSKSAIADLEKAQQMAERLQNKASGLQSATREFKRKIKLLESRLESEEKKNVALQRTLNKQKKKAQSPRQQSKHDSKETAKLRKQLQAARSELDSLRNYVSGRKDSWEAQNAELEDVHNQLAARNEEISRISDDVDERNSQLIRSREQYIATSDQLAQQKSKIRKLAKKNRELERTLLPQATADVAACQMRIAEQSGELASKNQQLEALAADNQRIQQYSDSLRMQLQDQLAVSNVSVAMRHKLEAGVDSANETINKLNAALEAEKEANRDHINTIENLRSEFDEEIGQIRLELGESEETLAEQAQLAEQLASDLLDHQDYRQALESQLSEAERRSEDAIRKLTRELKKARTDSEEYSRKIGIKDNAIAELIQELSNHTSNIELKGDVENALQGIDGFRSDSDNEAEQDNRDRVARLLVGNVDGRMLRFPLFKDRLTIGRTSHNDIQLNMQYVSRRHAVISTDNGQTRVIDWGSKNGVYVNEKQIGEQVLHSGDVVSIGMADFRYEERAMR